MLAFDEAGSRFWHDICVSQQHWTATNALIPLGALLVEVLLVNRYILREL
ncbi:hypothetical protein PC116_g2932 [Phytophthora cactorum]|uniref:Uncharacterized protein n=1 Tax=Phytophthora cactorum TaxID=29920 RepID=A0A8T1LKL0_9STRA|nr:hypothetical protein Pcac1_g16760 [Phytophthora cactorum]KAG2776077.1 hypothetical protein Pcac1_g13361 [Phytophthora cactorum]KAG2890764.1 hypothetical protein PC114_g17286 [Phytophthora cactorum]KAG2920324.1 hypothetical protein PC117_g16519 [Phytophthora cactorum]KAG3013108.1 hypothetical protein PC119_g12645 [Phytophthora cactorum]